MSWEIHKWRKVICVSSHLRFASRYLIILPKKIIFPTPVCWIGHVIGYSRHEFVLVVSGTFIFVFWFNYMCKNVACTDNNEIYVLATFCFFSWLWKTAKMEIFSDFCGSNEEEETFGEGPNSSSLEFGIFF